LCAKKYFGELEDIRLLTKIVHSPGANGTMFDWGWSNSSVFRDYLKDHFIKFIPRREPHQYLLLIFDGHKSQISVDLIDWAKEQKIILFILPAHTSHILQLAS